MFVHVPPRAFGVSSLSWQLRWPSEGQVFGGAGCSPGLSGWFLSWCLCGDCSPQCVIPDVATRFAPQSDAWQEIQDWPVRRNYPVAPGVSVLDLLVALSAAAFVALCDRYQDLGKLYEPTQKLRDMAANNQTFYTQ